MSKIQNKFKKLSSQKEKGLIAYIMLGYPNLKDSISAIHGLVKGGADIIEIGIPFSDPIADGPIIQNASNVSLKNKITIEKLFRVIKKISMDSEVPLVLMTYANILFKKGYGNFMNAAKKAGISGLILPDMSVEESNNYLNAAKQNNMDTIFLISPNTTNKRIKKIANKSSGFLYLVSVYGTTGVHSKIQKYSLEAIKKTKKIINGKIPLGVGFGISNAKDARKVLASGADAIIVGSAFLKLIEKTPPNQIESKIASFTKSLKQVTKCNTKE